jgi:hypothetical protein
MAGLILLTARPGVVQAQKKDDDKGGNSTQGTPAEYAMLSQMREVVGKLGNLAGKSLTFDVEYIASVSGGGGNNNNPFRNQGGGQQNYAMQMARLMQQQQQAMRTQNPQQRQQKMRQIAQQMQKMKMQQYGQKAGGGGVQTPNVNTAYKEFEADISANVVVRKNFLPFEYDDKGYAKTYTQAELAALRGKDTSKPGYTAKFEDLQSGQIVKLYFGSAKSTTGTKDAKKDGKKGADDEGVGNVARPVVTMILILADPPANTMPAGNPPPKKKN